MHVPLECGYDLLCFSLNDTAYFPNSGPGCFLTVGKKEEPKKLVSGIFPNPINNDGYLEFNLMVNNAEIKFINLNGQTIKTIANFSGEKLKFNTADLANGVYQISITEKNNFIRCEKIIINH
jgi:hypothetical protein